MPGSRWLSISALCLFLPFSLHAQFFDLATTYDGSALYFSTYLRQAGTDRPYQGRIYRIDSNGLQLFREVTEVPPPPSLPAFLSASNYFNLERIDVSGDGNTMAIGAGGYCFGRQCSSNWQRFVTLINSAAGGAERRFSGEVRLSSNGRFAINVITDFSIRFSSIRDLQTGGSIGTDDWVRLSRTGRTIANNGTAVLAFGSLSIHRERQRTRIDLHHENAAESVVDAEGTTCVFASRWKPPEDTFSRLRIMRLSDMRIRTLVEGPGDFYQPSLSDDGRLVLFLSTAAEGGGAQVLPQAYVIRSDGSELRKMNTGDEGVDTAILSGDGRVVYCLTLSGRLLRVDVPTGTSVELIGRTPLLKGTMDFSNKMFFLDAVCTAGSLCKLTGSGLVAGADPVKPAITVGDFTAPVLSAAPNEVVFQVPWEASPARWTSVFMPVKFSTKDTPFSLPPLFASIHNFNPKFLTLDSYPLALNLNVPWTLAVHQDFGSLVTPASPAQPGEIVHLYATGLGPVLPPVLTGQPAPADPLAQIWPPFSCAFSLGGLSSVPLFAGLAPGMIGIYQISLPIPRDVDVRNDSIGFRCWESFTGMLPVKR